MLVVGVKKGERVILLAGDAILHVTLIDACPRWLTIAVGEASGKIRQYDDTVLATVGGHEVRISGHGWRQGHERLGFAAERDVRILRESILRRNKDYTGELTVIDIKDAR